MLSFHNKMLLKENNNNKNPPSRPRRLQLVVKDTTLHICARKFYLSRAD